MRARERGREHSCEKFKCVLGRSRVDGRCLNIQSYSRELFVHAEFYFLIEELGSVARSLQFKYTYSPRYFATPRRIFALATFTERRSQDSNIPTLRGKKYETKIIINSALRTLPPSFLISSFLCEIKTRGLSCEQSCIAIEDEAIKKKKK